MIHAAFFAFFAAAAERGGSTDFGKPVGTE